YNVFQGGFFYITFYICEVKKSLSSFCVFRRFKAWERVDKILSYIQTVHHFILGVPGMYDFSFYSYFGAGGVKVFQFEFAHLTAIHGISPFGSKFIHIGFMCASANLLIGSESYLDGSMRNMRIIDEIFHGGYNFGYTGFIIGSQKRGAIGCDEGLSHVEAEV